MDKNINWKKIKKIYFIGIKGVGMMPLALIAKEAGLEVAGSDIDEEFITDEVLKENNIKIDIGFEEKKIVDFFNNEDSESCLVITTGAHSGYDNPQVKKAGDMKVNYLNQGEALGIFMSGLPFERNLKGITVTGSHGKTTISAMLASALSVLKYDPSYTVGTSRILPIGDSGHLGTGEYFIAEGDEYVGEPVYDKTPKILYQSPKFAIINNIDFDHPDVYEDIEDVKATMLEFINNMKEDGVIIANSDDSNFKDIKEEIRKDLKVITYGEENADYVASNISENIGSVTFDVEKGGKNLGSYLLKIPGKHNALNALSVIALLHEIDIENQDKVKALSKYKGSKRRMEFIGKTKEGALVVDDYGHHPIEIKSTLRALKNFYSKKIICVFQSHTYSRTRKLLDEFSKSFMDVDELVLIPVFKSQRDTESDIISDDEFGKPFKEQVEKVYTAKGIEDAANYLKDNCYDSKYLILTMGAGDVYKVGYKLI